MGFTPSRTDESLVMKLSWRLPGTGSEIQERRPSIVQATSAAMPVVLCFPDHRSLRERHDQHGNKVPSITYCLPSRNESAVGTNLISAPTISGVIAAIARLMVGWETP